MNTRHIPLFLFLFLITACSAPPDLQPEDIDMARRFLDDDFDYKAARRTPAKPIPTVKTIESSSGPWVGATSNNFGQQVLYTDNPQQKISVLKMPLHGAPKVHTVHLGLSYDPGIEKTPLGFEQFAMLADVTLGCGGSTVEFTMDWKNGVSFSAMFNSIEVVGRYDPFYQGASEVYDLRLSAIVGEGGAYVGRPTYTPYTFQNVLPAGSSDILKIPSFARRMRVIEQAGGTSVVGDAYDPTNIVEFGYTYVLAPVNGRVLGDVGIWLDDGIPIPNGAHYFRVVNNASNELWLAFEFELDI